jgi:hypothetical protein
VVFQLAAERLSEAAIFERYRLPDEAYAVRIEPIDPPAMLRPGETATVRLIVTNASPYVLAHDIAPGVHICIANHWLRAAGTVEIPDDGRAVLPATLAPGESCEVDLTVQAPVTRGAYVLELDLVQERICWFAQKASKTARVPIDVSGEPVIADVAPVPSGPADRNHRGSLFRRLLRPFRRGRPTFEMHVVPRADVEAVIMRSGGQLLKAIDDGAAGYRWLSYTYVSRKSG